MVKSLEVKPSLLGKTNTALQMLFFVLGLCRPIWGIPSVQLFLPLEGIVCCTTIASLVTYALNVNKALKWGNVKAAPSDLLVDDRVVLSSEEEVPPEAHCSCKDKSSA